MTALGSQSQESYHDRFTMSKLFLFPSTDPSSITFSVVFKTRDSPTLREVTKRSLESQLPRYNVTGARNTLYEVMPAGGMLFLLRNMTLPPEVKTVTVVPPAQTVTHVVKPSLTSSYMTIAPGMRIRKVNE